MQERTTDTVGLQAESAKDVLTEILQEGAHKMLATAIEAEVDAYINEHADQRDAVHPEIHIPLVRQRSLAPIFVILPPNVLQSHHGRG